MKLLYEASNFTIQVHWVVPFAILGFIGLMLLIFAKKPFFKLLSAVCLIICAVAALRFIFGGPDRNRFIPFLHRRDQPE